MYKEIAMTILQQLGGSRFVAMTGAKKIAYGKLNPSSNSIQLSFQFPNCKKSNTCTIVLNGLDLYDVGFYRYNPKTLESHMTEEIKDVFSDMLQDVFEAHTGLLTHF